MPNKSGSKSHSDNTIDFLEIKLKFYLEETWGDFALLTNS